MKPKHLRFALLLTMIESYISLALILSTPSETSSAVLFGFSPWKLLLAGLVLLIAILLTYGVIKTHTAKASLDDPMTIIDGFIHKGDHAFYITCSFLLAAILLLSLLVIGMISQRNIIFVVLHNFWYLILWFSLSSLQLGIVIYVNNIGYFREHSRTIKLLIILLLVSLNIFQWIVIIFRLNVYTRITNWFWVHSPYKQLSSRDLFFVVLVFATTSLAWFLLNKRVKLWIAVLLLTLGGIVLQFGFGIIDGRLPSPIIEKFSTTSHVIYAEEAAREPDILEIIRQYETTYGKSSFNTGTKPPGVLMLYALSEKIANTINPQSTYEARLEVLLSFIGYVYPILSFLIVIPLYALGRLLGRDSMAIISCLFYIVFPNVLLVPIFLDQVLYPLLLTISLLSLLLSLNKSSVVGAVITGSFFYLSLFFSFSMLPVLFMSFLITTLYFLPGCIHAIRTNERPRMELLKYVRFLAGLIVGFSIMAVIFVVLFQYNPLIRYTSAMELHRQIKGIHSIGLTFHDIPSFLTRIVLSNADFSFWIGFTPIMLCLLALQSTIKNITTKRTTMMDWVTVSFVVTYILLNISGQTVNETGRLWIFLTPALSLMMANQPGRLFPHKNVGVYFILALQLLTTYFIFHFNDFAS